MRILFVGMANSIHTARWISQLNDQGWDIHLFPIGDLGVHPELKNLTIHDSLFNKRLWKIDKSISLNRSWRFPKGKNLAIGLLERFRPYCRDRAWRLSRTIRSIRPDVIHSFYTQLSGYLTLDAREYLSGNFPPWVHSSWGQDFFFLGQKPEHKRRITAVLSACDYFIADCERDIHLAKEFGFKQEVLGVFPTPGGYDIRQMQKSMEPFPVSSRKVIVLKGYHNENWTGRALNALQALHMCADSLKRHKIIIYSSDLNVRYAAEYVVRLTGLNIDVLPQSPHNEILRRIGQARIAIGICTSDGTPNAMLEAMVMGAFPIQSDTISTAEWIEHGKNGFLVPPEDPEIIATAIHKALSDDPLIDQAAQINTTEIAKRIDSRVIQPQIIAMYNKVYEKTGK